MDFYVLKQRGLAEARSFCIETSELNRDLRETGAHRHQKKKREHGWHMKRDCAEGATDHALALICGMRDGAVITPPSRKKSKTGTLQ